jgi:hypothetical protein
MSIINDTSALLNFLPTKKQLAFLLVFKYKERIRFNDQRIFSTRRDYYTAVNFWISKGILGKSGADVLLIQKWFPQFVYNWFVDNERR